MNSAAVSNKIRPVCESLFLFPPHHDSAGDIHKYLRHAGARFGRGKVRLEPAQSTTRCKHGGFSVPMCTIIRVSRGMIVVAIEIGAVEIDIVDSDRVIQFVIVEDSDNKGECE
jgi:hypothetical protein